MPSGRNAALANGLRRRKFSTFWGFNCFGLNQLLMQKRGVRHGLATLCAGGEMGTAIIVAREV